jgi:hypothetical protein
MAEAKTAKTKRAAKSTKTAHKADLVEMAAHAAAETTETLVEASPAPQSPAPTVQPVEVGAIFSSARKQGDAIRQAMSEAVAASAKGALEVNGKIIEAFNIQSNAALDLWRSAIKPSPLPEAFQAQTSATRQAYQAASEQWKSVAETTALWFTRSLEPLQSAFHSQKR